MLYANSGDTSRAYARPIIALIGYAEEPLVTRLDSPLIYFFIIEGEYGHNIPILFHDYIAQHGGIDISGYPITEIFPYEDGVFRQCFESLCLNHNLDAPEGLQIYPAPLGSVYKTLYYNPDPPPQSEPQSEIQIQVWEEYALIDSGQSQIIYVSVFQDQIPMANLKPNIQLTLPDGTRSVYVFPATNEKGSTSLNIPAVKAANGSLIHYEVCLDEVNLGKLCINENYVIWGNDDSPDNPPNNLQKIYEIEIKKEYDELNTSQKQILYIKVLKNKSPVANVKLKAYLSIDEAKLEYQLQPTDENGESRLEISHTVLLENTTAYFEVCIEGTSMANQCKDDYYKLVRRVDEIWKNLPEGTIIFETPDEMMVAEIKTVKVRITNSFIGSLNSEDGLGKFVVGGISVSSPDSTNYSSETPQITFTPIVSEEASRPRHTEEEFEDLLEGFSEDEKLDLENIPVSDRMKVELGGEPFHITSLQDPNEQMVFDEEYAEWDFEVSTKEVGTHTLYLIITAFLSDGDMNEPKPLPFLSKEIIVKVNPLYSTKIFFQKNWQWVSGVILIPLLTLGWKKYSDKKSKANIKSKKKIHFE